MRRTIYHCYSHMSIVCLYCVELSKFQCPLRPFFSSLKFARTQTRKRFSLNIVGPWEIKFLFWSGSGEWFVIQNYHISTVFHAHIPVSLRGVHQKRLSPDVEKLIENGESAAACGKCNGAGVVAWLHSLHFLLRSPICISLAIINCLFLRCFSPCNERFSRMLFEVENYHRPSRRWDKSVHLGRVERGGTKRINCREAIVGVSQVWVWRFQRRIRPIITHKHMYACDT